MLQFNRLVPLLFLDGDMEHQDLKKSQKVRQSDNGNEKVAIMGLSHIGEISYDDHTKFFSCVQKDVAVVK